MTKKYIIFIITGTLLIIASVFYVLRKHQPHLDTAFRAVPANAEAIVDIKDFNGFMDNFHTKNQLWEEMSKLSIFYQFNTFLKYVDSLRRHNPPVQKFLFRHNEILITAHPSGKDDIQLLYIIRLESDDLFNDIDKMIKKIPGAYISNRSYAGANLNDIKIPAKQYGYTYSYHMGLLMISRSPGLVENAIRQISSKESITSNKELDKLLKSAGKKSIVNFYLQYGLIRDILPAISHPRFKKDIRFISKFGYWVELDLNTKPGMMILNGFSVPNPADKDMLSVFVNQKPMKFEIFGKLPASVGTFIVLGISDIDQYWKDYNAFRLQQNIPPVNSASLEMLSDSLQINVKNDFRTIFENECGTVLSEALADSGTFRPFSLVKVKSHDDAEKILDSWIQRFSEVRSIKPETLISEAKIDEDIRIKIYDFQAGNIPYMLFGNIFNYGTNRYCTLFDNYLLFGESSEVLQKFVNSIMLNTTLSTDIEFSNISDYFSSQSNFIFYTKPSLSFEVYKYFLNKEVGENIQVHRQNLNNIQALVYQFNSTDTRLIYNNLFVKYAPVTTYLSPKAIWESQIEGKITGKPLFVKNHLTNETEIILQDDKYNIYLLNKVGRILWKVNVDEPVLSKIYQVDFYKNRKLQYFFNTASKLYCIDRNGKFIEKFPVSLKAPASNGIAIFDYEKNREYRLYYAGLNKKVYTLDKEGKEIDGWKFQKTEGPVKHPLQHFRILGKDYIVFNDNYRIYIVNRKGETRIKPETNFYISEQNPVSVLKDRNANKYSFVSTDTTGVIHYIDLKGKVTTTELGIFPSNHSFDVMDINANGTDDFIVAWDKNLKGFTSEGKEILSIHTDYPISGKPEFYEFTTNNFKIGLLTSENERIYLYDCSGNLYNGFPLKGTTQFSIGLFNNSEKRFNLIVGSNKNLLYNYSVQ